MVGTTIPHEVDTEFSASRVMLKPASQGTGVIAGGSVRAVVEAAGIRDILAKIHGSTNPVNVTRATIEALRSLHSAEELSARRGVRVRSYIPGQTGDVPPPPCASRRRSRTGAGRAAVAAKLRVTQVKSTISHIARNRATVRALGLHRIGDTVEVPDNDATRGMVRQVRFLVRVEEIDAPEATAKPRRPHALPSRPDALRHRRGSRRREAPAKETE